MNIDGTEKTEGKVCTKCGEWKPLDEYNKHKLGKYGRQSKCRECQKEYKKQWHQNNKEYCKEYGKQWRGNNPEYRKQHHQNNKEYYKEQHKQWKENNKEHLKEYKKQWRRNNPEYDKQYRENNKEHYKEYTKQYYQNNKEHIKEHIKRCYQNNKQNNLQYISSIVEQIKPVFKQLNLPIYGYVYMFENIKTGHKYVGQSILPITKRYTGGIVQGWIKERLNRDNQKFKDELIEEDIKVTEILDIAFCQYHLDKLETYYIDKYNSYNNGYNNREGNHNTNDGLEEFEEILQQYNIEFVDGEIKEKRLPKQA